MDFIYIVAIIILVILLARRGSANNEESYAKGYQDGYHALAGKVQKQLDKPSINRSALHAAIKEDESPAVLTQQTTDFKEIVRKSEPAKKDPVNHSLRNMNILLYMASFLLVAAGVAFIGAAVDDSVKLIGVWVLAMAFYGTGLLLHKQVAYLRPAALAFVGTGLALIPFGGLALNQFGYVEGTIAWLLTSCIGMGLYFIAAVRLQSVVVSYLTMAFVLSFVSASIETASLSLLWQFVAMIVVSLGASVIAYIKPDWTPRYFAEPIERTGQIVTPVALFASCTVGSQLTLQAYEIIFGVASAHYMIAWLQQRRLLYEYVARAILHITLLVVFWDVMSQNVVGFGLVFLSLAMLQIVYSLIAWPRKTELYWIFAAFVLQVIGIGYWAGHENSALLTAASLIVIAMSSLMTMQTIQKAVLGLPGLMVTMLLPFVLRQMTIPYIDYFWVEIWFAVLAIAALIAYKKWALKEPGEFQVLIAAGFAGYATFTLLLSGLILHGNAAMILFLMTAVIVAGSYVFKKPLLLIAAVIMSTFAMWHLWVWLGQNTLWQVLAPIWIVAGAWYVISWLLASNHDEIRQKMLLFSAWGIAMTGAVLCYTTPFLSVAAGWTIVVVALTVIVEGYRSGRGTVMEIGVYIATFGLQRVIGLESPGLSLVVYGHWWALTIALVALWRRQFMPRLVIAMVLITYTTAGYALSLGGGYALLFLAEHVALAIIGAMLNRSWAIWWGSIAASLAVLYFLRDIAFLAFGFLGLLLIGFVIWRLKRSATVKK